AFLEYVRHDCSVRPKIAAEGDLLVRGQTYLCEERAFSIVERDNGTLRLRRPTGTHGAQATGRIDQLFVSCAHCAGKRAAAILLDSASPDGANGLRQIHAIGGRAISQQCERSREQGKGASAARGTSNTRSRAAGTSLLLDQIVPALFV
ncbi:MAG TPA: chemotaxis protein CheB, partial [Polyangiaceae bacterium]